MTAHVFMLRPGAPPRVHFANGVPNFGRDRGDEQFHVVESDDAAEILKSKERRGQPLFQWLTPDELDDALGSADEAVAHIKAGDHDGDLALLLFAEQQLYDNRVTVVDALAERQRAREQEMSREERQTVTPEDLAGV